MDESGDLLVKVESGFRVELPAERAIDADGWLAPLAGFGVKSVDFLCFSPEHGDGLLAFIEFKTSMPAPDGMAKRPGALSESCRAIVEKVERTAGVILARRAGRMLGVGIEGPGWMTPEVCRGRWQVILVVTGARPEWLEPVRNQLRETLRPLARSVGLEVEPKVLNGALAERSGLGRAPVAAMA